MFKMYMLFNAFTACSDIILLCPFEQWMHSLIFCKLSSHYRCLVYLFADVLNGLLCKERWKGNMPRVHCYCFMRSNETRADIIKVWQLDLYGICNSIMFPSYSQSLSSSQLGKMFYIRIAQSSILHPLYYISIFPNPLYWKKISPAKLDE